MPRDDESVSSYHTHDTAFSFATMQTSSGSPLPRRVRRNMEISDVEARRLKSEMHSLRLIKGDNLNMELQLREEQRCAFHPRAAGSIRATAVLCRTASPTLYRS